MRYSLPTDRLVNQLLPHYLNGRQLILLVQSLVSPLLSLNLKFKEFAKIKLIEARMTSQVMYFEWYLSWKFQEYFKTQDEQITILQSEDKAVKIWHENTKNGHPFTIWFEGEEVASETPVEEKPQEFYYKVEEKMINKVSFIVLVPKIKINKQEFVYMLTHIINTYKLAGKTYLIQISQ